MKVVFGILMAVVSTAAVAAPTTVTGKPAEKLFQALKGIGVQVVARVGASSLEVSKVDCDHTPRGFIWAQCDLYDHHAPTDLRERLHPIGTKAHTLHKAMVGAGIEEVTYEFGTTVKASNIKCSSAVVAAKGGAFRCVIRTSGR